MAWKSWCAYSTPKVVKIQDWRLGLIHFSFQLAIFAYVVGYAIIYQRGFMFKEQITGGSVTLNSRAPSAGAAVNSYCCVDGAACANNASQLSCAFWDQYQAEWPAATNTEIAITTRATVTSQTAPDDCDYQRWDETCVWTDDDAAVALFIANAEDFTIRIRHGVRGQQVPTEGANTGPAAMSGKMVSPDHPDNVLRVWPQEAGAPYPDQGADRSGDIISLREILDAVGLNLDTIFTDINGALTTARYDGINIVLSIGYDMEGIAGESLSYTYTPRLLSKLEYKIEEAQMMGNANTRTIINRHAVRLIVIQTGEIGVFDFTSMLITLVTALGLLAVANLLTTMVMTKALELKDVYAWHTMEVTEDVDIVRALEPRDLEVKRLEAKRQTEKGRDAFLKLGSSSTVQVSTEREPLLPKADESDSKAAHTNI